MTDNFCILPRPRLANTEPFPCLLIYFCHRPKVHKLLPGAGCFLICSCFTAGKVISEGSFCVDFWWGLRSTSVLRIFIPGQNQKSGPKVSKVSINQGGWKDKTRYTKKYSLGWRTVAFPSLRQWGKDCCSCLGKQWFKFLPLSRHQFQHHKC